MSERMYLFVVGAVILTALYIENNILIYVLSMWLLFEGASGILLTRLSHKIIPIAEPVGLTTFRSRQRFDFEALRATRIVIAFFLGRYFFSIE